jgi:hypothetical protein
MSVCAGWGYCRCGYFCVESGEDYCWRRRGSGRAGPVGRVSTDQDSDKATHVKSSKVDGLLANVGGVEGRHKIVDRETHWWWCASRSNKTRHLTHLRLRSGKYPIRQIPSPDLSHCLPCPLQAQSPSSSRPPPYPALHITSPHTLPQHPTINTALPPPRGWQGNGRSIHARAGLSSPRSLNKPSEPSYSLDNTHVA